MTDFGEIKLVDIRDIWPNEATNFTPWLVDNIDKLSQALGMEIEVQEREADVGDFSLDIMGKDLGSGRTVVIVNQLTETDHDHLGKLLTYAGGFDAGVLVWIAKKLRDEHRKALEWLNERTGPDVDCFGVVIEVMRIDDSKPAFNFKPEVYIDLQDKEHNKNLFDRLLEQQAEIEKEYGANLAWERLDDKRASRIAIYRNGSIDASTEIRSELLQWSIQNLLKMKKVILPKAKAVLMKITEP